MKKFFLAITALTAMASCTVDHANSEKNNEAQTINAQNEAKKANQTSRLTAQRIASTTEITVTTQARGFYQATTLKGRTVTKSSSGIVPPSSYTISTTKFNTIDNIFYGLTIDLIPYFNAPSTTFVYDGARSEVLTVVHNGITYTSKTYDEGNPNIVLKNLVNNIKGL
ncbi:hypothetical protein [Flavobacterium sp.]|uniref:hypothetical protein n=1 Tax=Flavobacterium sp. TaxID=239 RepID=UPI003D10DBC9